MKLLLGRLLSLVAGLTAGAVAILLPLLFISNEFSEAESAEQYGGHPLLGKIGAVLAGLAFAGILGYVGYRLIRYAVKSPESN
jgi:hypothetical protein